jgi:hypothetical protein
MRRHFAAGRFDQPRPALRMTLFVLRQLFENFRALLIRFRRRHRSIQCDAVFLDDVIRPVSLDVLCRDRLWFCH